MELEIMSLTKQNICPSCNTLGMEVFYKAKDVPINSCLMFTTQQEAVSFPRGDVVLGFCKSCGFISNLAFDHSEIVNKIIE